MSATQTSSPYSGVYAATYSLPSTTVMLCGRLLAGPRLMSATRLGSALAEALAIT